MLTPNQILDVAGYAGQIILTNGAEIYRTEDTITRICKAYGMKDVQSLVTPTGIFISVVNSDGNGETIVRRIRFRSLNLAKIARVNEFSRSLEKHQLDYAAALHGLKKIETARNEYRIDVTILLSSIGAAINVLLMRANLINIIPALLASLLAQIVVRRIGFLKGVNFVPEMFAGFIAGLVSLICFELGLGDSLGIITVSAILPFVPGVSLTNAIRDAINDDLISANSRATEAALVAVSLAIGVAISLGVLL